MSGPARPNVTLRDVAVRAGLSVMTASYTFSQPQRVSAASRDRVLAAARELDYQPNAAAKSLRTGKANAVGVIFSEHLAYAFRDPQAAQFLAGVADVCTEHGFGLTMLPTSGGREDPTVIASAPVDGFVFWTTTADDPTLAAAIRTGKPVTIQGGPAVEDAECIGIDDRRAAQAVARLALHGSHRPLIVSFPLSPDRVPSTRPGLDPDTAPFPVTRHRLLGYREAVTEAGLSWSETTTAVLSHNDRGEAAATTRDLLAGHSDRFDTAICMSDEIAAGVLAAARQLHIAVPQALAITGYDNGPDAETLQLTTIDQDLYRQGRTSAETAMGLQPASATPSPWRICPRATTRPDSHTTP